MKKGNKRMKKKTVRNAMMLGLVLASASGYSVPFTDKSLGGAIERAVTHEIAEAAAKRSLKTGVARGVSTALAGVTPKQLMAGGVMGGTLIAAHNLSAGSREVDAARAEVIRTTGATVAREIPNRPELATEMLSGVGGNEASPFERMKRWFNAALPWACGAVGLTGVLFLLGYLLKGMACMRRGVASLSTTLRQDDDGSVPMGICHEEADV